MTIRKRTDGVAEGSGLRRAAGGAAAGGLAAAAAVHAAWATGSTWPASGPDELADLVVGRRPFPSPALTWGVTGLLGAATGLTAARAGLVPSPRRARRPVRLGADVVAAVLLARGVTGLVSSAAGIGQRTPAFRRWDLRLYSPLCLVLGLLTATSSPERGR